MDKALRTLLANIPKRAGRSLDELVKIVKDSGLTRHGQVVSMLKDTLGMGHGDANTVAHLAFGTGGLGAADPGAAPGAEPAATDVGAELDRIYGGPKAALRPVHDALMGRITPFGSFEIAPKKTYLSLRRKKQFATLGPATNTRIEVGLNMKGVKGTARLEALPPGGMCQYRVRLGTIAEVDAELAAWIKQAFEAAG